VHKKKSASFFCPGKIFIVGEYACLTGKPAIIATLKPDFKCVINESLENINELDKNPFAEASPSGQYIKNHYKSFSKNQLTWFDPYEFPLGVGSSSAQFIFAAQAERYITSQPFLTHPEILSRYWDIIGETQGLKPSGLDIVSQFLGGTHLLSQGGITESLENWNHAQATFLLAFTNVKTKTHEHLLNLKSLGFPEKFKLDITDLNSITSLAHDAWRAKDPLKLGECLNSYQNILNRCGFSDASFQNKISYFSALKGVFGAKGSGAQGGDCVLLLADTDSLESLENEIKIAGWQAIKPEWSRSGFRVEET
jgi:mevalonate kinase